MIGKLTQYSAYHGGSWKPRLSTHQTEYARRSYWPGSGMSSEYRPLREVLLYRPPERPLAISRPEAVQHLAPLDWGGLGRELATLARALRKEGVGVRWLEADWFRAPRPNLMFVRDHFMLTPWGAILGRMASPVRAGEEKWAQLALASAEIPILEMIRGAGTFEGADGLWLSPRTVLVGVGNRTNAAGFAQVSRLLTSFGVETIAIPLPRQVQHLLGLLQFVGPRRALLRDGLAPPALVTLLRRRRFAIVSVPESEEVTRGLGMSLLCVAPGRVILADGCPGIAGQLARAGLEIAARIAIPQLARAAGGIGCATAPLSR